MGECLSGMLAWRVLVGRKRRIDNDLQYNGADSIGDHTINSHLNTQSVEKIANIISFYFFRFLRGLRNSCPRYHIHGNYMELEPACGARMGRHAWIRVLVDGIYTILWLD